MSQSQTTISTNGNEEKLIQAIQGLTARLKAEQIKTFKDGITIKMLMKEIARLKGQLVKTHQQPSSFNFSKILTEVNKSLQSELSLTDADVSRHVSEWNKKIQKIEPLI